MSTNRSIITAILLLGGIGTAFFLVWPGYQKLQVKSQDLKNSRIELGYTSDYYKNLEELSERLRQYDPVLAKIDSALPSNLSMPEFLNYFQVITAQNGVVASGLGMPAVGAATESGIKDVKLGLSLTGSYQSLKNLMTSLYSSAKIIEIDSVSFSTPKDGEMFDFRIETKTHSY